MRQSGCHPADNSRVTGYWYNVRHVRHTHLSVATRITRVPISALIESELEVIQKQLARLPTRRELARTALGITFATMMLTMLSLLFFLH
jgi:hypothetical protein